MVRLRPFVLILTLTMGLLGPAAAQAAHQASPPARVACGSVTPQAADELVETAFPSGTPDALPARLLSAAMESDLPQGEPADPSTAAAVEQVVQTWLVCILAGEEARLFGLMTDELDVAVIQQFITFPTADTPAELRALLQADLVANPGVGTTATVAPPGRDLRMLDDGRVGGIWTVEGNAAFIILKRHDEGWLIDDVIDILEPATPAAGTPTA